MESFKVSLSLFSLSPLFYQCHWFSDARADIAPITSGDFDKFWQVASKLLPLPSPIIPSPSSDSTSTRISSPIDGGSKSRASALADGRPLEGNNMRSVPMRIYLPDGGPVLQDIVAPLMEGESPLLSYEVGATVTLESEADPTASLSLRNSDHSLFPSDDHSTTTLSDQRASTGIGHSTRNHLTP